MENTLTFRKNKVLIKIATVIASVAASVVFVQLFHCAGMISGLETAVGSALLPMHIPVLIAGFLCGPSVGFAVGALSPLLSFMISGMPTAALLPFMVIELAAYGLVSGTLSKTKLPLFVSVLTTQIAGRVARAMAVVFAIYAMGNDTLTLASIKAFILSGIFGIVIQWVAVPFAVEKMKGLRKYYE
ncbi:MAG: ECF transporter S component [Clostridia bacterium]|nr:ECF transporter S component [Clostridia bacterium]